MLQETFLSFWYWALSALFWAVICNWTYGVPNELVGRAKRNGGEDAELFERFARRNIKLISRAIDRQAVFMGAFLSFILAVLATLAIRNGSEAAQGALFIVGPIIAMGVIAGWRLKRLQRKGLTRERILKLFLSERFNTAILAGLSMVAAYAYTTAKHGPGWTEALFRGL